MKVKISNLRRRPVLVPGGPELSPGASIVVDSSAVQLARCRRSPDLKVEVEVEVVIVAPAPVRPKRKSRDAGILSHGVVSSLPKASGDTTDE